MVFVINKSDLRTLAMKRGAEVIIGGQRINADRAQMTPRTAEPPAAR